MKGGEQWSVFEVTQIAPPGGPDEGGSSSYYCVVKKPVEDIVPGDPSYGFLNDTNEINEKLIRVVGSIFYEETTQTWNIILNVTGKATGVYVRAYNPSTI